jgi:hypothetical protein
MNTLSAQAGAKVDSKKARNRRNLSAYQRSVLALKLEEVFRAKARDNLKTSTGGNNPQPLQKSEKVEPINTQKEIAKVAGISHDTIAKVKIIEERGSQEQKERGTLNPRE